MKIVMTVFNGSGRLSSYISYHNELVDAENLNEANMKIGKGLRNIKGSIQFSTNPHWR